jgi:FtsP/CotA-like multicopper oxidase with cupredoxin domain
MPSAPKDVYKRPVVVLVLFFISACEPAPIDALDTLLLKEFHGAYTKDAPSETTTHEVILVAAETEVILPDQRRLAVWSYNGDIPGPTIRLGLGQKLRVIFTNRLSQATTIHWHGIRVPNAMDGVPGVTQDPIQPDETFIYEFVPKDAGTFWFHPHHRSSEQVERGLFGAVIVDDPQPPGYTQDKLWILDDWRLDRQGAIDDRFVTRHDLAHDGRWGNVITVNGSTQHQLNVHSGERIRLRLLNSANGRVFAPDFGSLKADIIAVDGMYSAKPIPYKRFDMAPGNRIDLDITFPHHLAGQSIEVKDLFTRRPHHLATIHIQKGQDATPTFASPARATVPQWEQAHKSATSLVYALDSKRGGEYGIQWTLNGKIYEENTEDSLTLGRFNRMRFRNDSHRLHPMHIHGAFFKVLTRKGRLAPEPFWRDTVLVGPKESIDVGLVPMDEGNWLLHCHILEHAAAGMKTTVRVRSPKTWLDIVLGRK